MRVATWNINNVNKRIDLLVDWLHRFQPDVLALQELKAPTAQFPLQAIEAAGYRALVVGQKAWNGVALLSRGHEPLPVVTALSGDAADKEARYLEAAINGVLYACLYLPNGNPWPGPKFEYKLAWFERMQRRARQLWDSGSPVVLLGDWNVVPTDADIYKPDTWRDNALLQPQARQAFTDILAQGWTDALAAAHPDAPLFTFWDYRRKRWERNAGLRIDHILTSAGWKVLDAGVDRQERGKEGSSDHAPVWAELSAPGKAARRRKAATVPAATAAKAGNPPLETPVPLARYNAKRDFKKTAEPAGVLPEKPGDALIFVVQKHWASRLHYDFRLELDGVMLSWAVPKGPSFDPATKSMAIQVEDHPISYNEFEGNIPKGEYGGGTVIVWDRGTWEPVGDPREGMRVGKVLFKLHGQKLAGLWELVRISKPGEKKQDQWMLFKKKGDAWARPIAQYNVITALPDSVVDKPLGLVEAREPREPGARPSKDARPDSADAMRLARAADFPSTLAPQLATLVSSVPDGHWVIETKFDGYRLLARIRNGAVRLFTRNGNDWTDKLQALAAAIAAMGIEQAWLDGEIVVLDDAGLPDFNALQNAMDGAKARDIVMFVFDVPFFGEMDLRAVPLASRRALLRDLFEERESELVRFSQSFEVQPAQLLGAACRMGLEGVMVKRADAPYSSGRTDSWMKLKCQHRQEFVVVGFTDRSGGAKEVGGLLLGYHEAGELRYAGSVGTGWGSATGQDLHRKLSGLQIDKPALNPAELQPGRWTKRKAGTERWVEPTVVVEIAFTEWTPDKHVRHPVFRGIRTDKPAALVVREQPQAMPASKTAPPTKPKASTVKVSNPERVIDASTGLRKIDLVHYYESIAEFMLPHLKNRPTSLVRAPSGIAGQLFFQKHLEHRMPGVRELDAELWPGHTALLAVESVEALASAAQMNVVEFHTWNATASRIDRPDRFILDLDPGEGVTWPMLQEAAQLTRVMLTELGLESWLKTSGGKGLHVVVPITPKMQYDDVKAFSQAVVQHMARVIPSKFVAVMGGANRVGKIFIDYLRNGHGQTTACAFSARSRPGLGVSMPVSWEQLGALKSGSQWTIATAREYLSFQKEDPWAGYWKKKQTLAQGLRLLKR
ncbi:DNA ligase D [Xylophilus sp. GOD-11R]|uniref:DNA ligase D n=1 Tax=Xylophilus sp. GOD-11R TaxID=3089814 RepID=UPI00298D014B|nr:DNA ligase D [Xylophilus sp. GOD-11R]WPB58320.1 DNA ligase D [Xylophilus sp. GOD-11R]